MTASCPQTIKDELPDTKAGLQAYLKLCEPELKAAGRRVKKLEALRNEAERKLAVMVQEERQASRCGG